MLMEVLGSVFCFVSVPDLCDLIVNCDGRCSRKCSSQTSSPWDIRNSIKDKI